MLACVSVALLLRSLSCSHPSLHVNSLKNSSPKPDDVQIQVHSAVFSRRLLLLLRAWKFLVRVKQYSRLRVKRTCCNDWRLWKQWRKHAGRVQHTAIRVVKRRQQVLMYDVMAEWYCLLQRRFQQVVRVAKDFFVAWAATTVREELARQNKGQALSWVSQRSLALRTLLVWVFRGSRARSLQLARRWTSRAFHRWVSSTFRGRSSLPDALRRADTVLETLLYM